jgi:small subunit ribosomal protein S6
MPTPHQEYELTFVLDERSDQAEGTAKAEELKSFIAEKGGVIVKEEQWGRRELAYPIKKNRSGFYVTLNFTSPPEFKLGELEQKLNFDENVIRSLVTKAYTSAQPGTLSAAAEEAEARPAREGREEKGSAEEMLRRSSGRRDKTDAVVEEDPEADSLPEEERLKQLDESLEEMLKEDI